MDFAELNRLLELVSQGELSVESAGEKITAARQAELLGFAAIVAHHEPFPDNGRKPPPLPMCAR